jgi:hypothetical protein
MEMFYAKKFLSTKLVLLRSLQKQRGGVWYRHSLSNGSSAGRSAHIFIPQPCFGGSMNDPPLFLPKCAELYKEQLLHFAA